jgi:transposase InsO family protein
LEISRQSYYQGRKKRQRREVNGQLVAQLVKRERRLQPRLGTRKLHHMLKAELLESGVKVGRDRMFEELRKRQLLLEPVAAEYPCTTDSSHNLPIFENLIKDRPVEGPNQIWVSDVTYVRTREKFIYLALITDKFSRKVVGWHAGDSLEARGCRLAVEEAIAELPANRKPIHHSDRGSQYCSHEYVGVLQERGLKISMTQGDHCAQNAVAERMNGILKQEYGLGREFATKAAARVAIRQAIELYNRCRPHTALKYRTPEQVHSLAA